MIGMYELRCMTDAYLEDRMTLREFENWFVPTTFDKPLHAAADQLSADIELRIAEYTSGHLAEDELRRQLKTLIGGL